MGILGVIILQRDHGPTLDMNDNAEASTVKDRIATLTFWLLGDLFAQREARGQGVGRALMAEGMRVAAASGAERFIISTQVINLRSQGVWASLGFRLQSVFYTFHKWLDE